MATIPQIAMGFRQPEVASPLNMMAQLSQMQALQEANALRQAQTAKIEREAARENQLAQLLSTGQPLTLQQLARFPGGAKIFEEQQQALQRDQQVREDRMGKFAQALHNIRNDPSLDTFSRTWQYLKENNLGEGLEQTASQMMLMSPEARLDAVRRFIDATPGMPLYIAKLDEERAKALKTGTEARKTVAGARIEEARLSGMQGGMTAKEREELVPASIREAKWYKEAPEDLKGAFAEVAAAKRPTTTVTTTVSPGEKAEDIERGKLYVAQQKDVGNAATAARKSLVGIQSAQDVITRGFDTGFLTETKAKAASVLAGLGVADAEKYATDAQKFLQAATERVLAAQLDQKGVQTNQDAQRIEQAGARMGNTKAANEFILDVARAQAERAIAHDKFYRDWLRDPENKNSLRGAEDAWLESEGNKSIFESPRLKKYGVLESERMQTTPAPQGPVVGGRSATPRGAAPSGPQPPAAAVQSLLRGEGTDEQFDAVFGPGAAARARGR